MISERNHCFNFSLFRCLSLSRFVFFSKLFCSASVRFTPVLLARQISTQPVDWNNEIAAHSADVIADSSFIKHDYNRIVQYRQLVEQIKVATKQRCIADSLLINKALALNPNYYHAHQLAGYFWENCGFQIKAKQEFDEADRLR